MVLPVYSTTVRSPNSRHLTKIGVGDGTGVLVAVGIGAFVGAKVLVGVKVGGIVRVGESVGVPGGRGGKGPTTTRMTEAPTTKTRKATAMLRAIRHSVLIDGVLF